ncbi:MAG: ABC transporter permease, partial [Candidatus Hodarchaeales archaeon]
MAFMNKVSKDFQKLKFELGTGQMIFIASVLFFFVLFLILPIFTILYWAIIGDNVIFEPFFEIFKDSTIWGGGFSHRLTPDKGPIAAAWMWEILFSLVVTLIYYRKIRHYARKPNSFLGKYLGYVLISVIILSLIGFIGFFWSELKMVFPEPIRAANRPWGTKWIIQGPDMGGLMNSIIVATMTMIFSTIFGSLFAFIMARYTFHGKNFFRPLILIPLIIPPFVSIIGFHSILGESGVVNTILYDLFNVRIVLGGSIGIVFVQFLHFYTLVYLNVYSSLVNIDPSLEESAENLGARGLKLTTSITIPLAMPGLAAGAILAFILAIEDLGTPLIFNTLQTGDTFSYMPTLIFANIINYTGHAAKGYLIDGKYAALAAILVIIALIGFLLIRRFVSLRHYAMISKGRVGEPRTKPASIPLTLLLYVIFILFLPIALIPHLGTMLFSFGDLGMLIFFFLFAIILLIISAYHFLYKNATKQYIRTLGLFSVLFGILFFFISLISGIQFYIDNVDVNEAGFRRFLTYLHIGGTPDQVAVTNFGQIID